MALTLEVKNASGQKVGSVDLPADIFDAQTNIPLIHQVVTAQLAAARQGTQKAKNRGELQVQVRSLLSRREQVALVRAQSVLLCNVVAVLHMQFVHVHISSAHLRR